MPNPPADASLTADIYSDLNIDGLTAVVDVEDGEIADEELIITPVHPHAQAPRGRFGSIPTIQDSRTSPTPSASNSTSPGPKKKKNSTKTAISKTLRRVRQNARKRNNGNGNGNGDVLLVGGLAGGNVNGDAMATMPRNPYTDPFAVPATPTTSTTVGVDAANEDAPDEQEPGLIEPYAPSLSTSTSASPSASGSSTPTPHTASKRKGVTARTRRGTRADDMAEWRVPPDGQGGGSSIAVEGEGPFITVEGGGDGAVGRNGVGGGAVDRNGGRDGAGVEDAQDETMLDLDLEYPDSTPPTLAIPTHAPMSFDISNPLTTSQNTSQNPSQNTSKSNPKNNPPRSRSRTGSSAVSVWEVPLTSSAVGAVGAVDGVDGVDGVGGVDGVVPLGVQGGSERAGGGESMPMDTDMDMAMTMDTSTCAAAGGAASGAVGASGAADGADGMGAAGAAEKWAAWTGGAGEVDMCPLSPQDLTHAKSLVLDVLGWGVEPEYLVHVGVSEGTIRRVFGDLRLRMPRNLGEAGGGYAPAGPAVPAGVSQSGAGVGVQ